MAKVVKKRRVASQTFGSLNDLKKSTKRAGGGASGKIGFIPEDPITVRFLSEPETWVGYYEHYNGPNADPRYSPCVNDSSPGGCDYEPFQGNKPAFRYLANAYNVDQSKVQALKMPKSLVEQLVNFAQKYGTILDRDYELSRSGSGMDTTYSAVPEDKSPIKIARFRKDMSDLEQLLEDWASEQENGPEDDDDDEPVRRKGRGRHVEDDDDDDDEDEDDDYEPPSVPKRGTSRRVKADEFRPRRRPASTKGVEDDEDEKPRRTTKKTAAKKTVVARKTSTTKTPAKKVAAKRVVRRSR
jgi:hypothetical protein